MTFSLEEIPMAKSKKPLDEAFKHTMTNTLRDRSPYGAAKKAGLPISAIAKVLNGANPELSRAIEIAGALGFEVRYEWPRDHEAHRQATRLAVNSMMVMRPEFREFTENPMVWAFAEALVLSRETYARELGPSKTDDPAKITLAMLRLIEMQKARPATDG